MNEQLKQLLYNYLIDECDTPIPTAADIVQQYEGGVEHFGSPERLEYHLLAWYGRSLLVLVPNNLL